MFLKTLTDDSVKKLDLFLFYVLKKSSKRDPFQEGADILRYKLNYMKEANIVINTRIPLFFYVLAFL